MNLQEAYQTLGLNTGASPEDAKKKYRELTKKYHPDINKESGTEDKFKKINEAYQCIQNGKGNDPEPNFGGDVNLNDIWNFNNIQDMFGGFSGIPPRHNQRKVSPVQIATNVSFKDSVFGCKKEITYKRKCKCSQCNGFGAVRTQNVCTICNGNGFVEGRNGHFIIRQSCPKCAGTSRDSKPCDNCDKTGSVDSQATISVGIPAGIQNGVSLRLAAMGNFVQVVNNGDMYSDAFVKVIITNNTKFKLVDNDVISGFEINLIEAVKGCEKTIETLEGCKLITIPPLSRNKDEIILKNLGVGRVGNHRVILDVSYPDNLIKILETHGS